MSSDVSTTALPAGNTPATGTVIKTCDFEDGNKMCGYTNLPSNQYPWKITSQTTGSQGTGPQNDHTYQTRQGKRVDMTVLVLCNI